MDQRYQAADNFINPSVNHCAYLRARKRGKHRTAVCKSRIQFPGPGNKAGSGRIFFITATELFSGANVLRMNDNSAKTAGGEAGGGGEDRGGGRPGWVPHFPAVPQGRRRNLSEASGGGTALPSSHPCGDFQSSPDSFSFFPRTAPSHLT